MSLKYLGQCFALFIIFIVLLTIFVFVSYIDSLRSSLGPLLDVILLILIIIGLIYQGYKFSDFAAKNKYRNTFIVSLVLTVIMGLLALIPSQSMGGGYFIGLIAFFILFEIGSAVHYFKNRSYSY
jgi:hypothetical protein